MKGIILLIILITFNVSFCLAKCPTRTVNVSGKLLSKNGTPISAANVGVFIDEEGNGYFSKSDNNGYYNVSVLYDTYSGASFWGDCCKSIPSAMTIVIMADSYSPIKKRKEIKNIPLDNGIIFEPITLDRTEEEERGQVLKN